jgi:hypothetical protein
MRTQAGPAVAGAAAPSAGIAPAYAAQAAGSGGKVLIAIGLAALIIAAAFVGYKIFGGSAEVKDSFARFDTTSPARDSSPPATAPQAPMQPVAPTPEPPKAEEKSAPPPIEAPKAEALKAEPLPAPKAEAAKSMPADGERPKPPPAPKAEKGPPKASGTTGNSPTTQGQTQQAAPAPATPAPAPAAAAPVQDRWAQMAAEQQQCQKENLFNRVICDQRVRLRFCKDYWGTVPQCPGAVANPDRGQ